MRNLTTPPAYCRPITPPLSRAWVVSAVFTPLRTTVIWVPRAVTPFVGAGAGAIKYQFEQDGSFVDFQTRRVFNDTFRSTGWAPSVHALVGADLRVYRRLYITGEARYTWSSAPLSADFVDFEPIDLAGARLGASLKLVF